MSETSFETPSEERAFSKVINDKELSKEDHPFLQLFTPAQLAKLSKCSSKEKVKAGVYLFHENQKVTHQYLIVKGRVAMELNAPGQPPWIIMTVCDRGIVGYGWVYSQNYYFSCKAVIDTQVISLDAEYLMAMCEQDHDLGYPVMKLCADTMAERLRATRIQLLDILSSSPMFTDPLSRFYPQRDR